MHTDLVEPLEDLDDRLTHNPTVAKASKWNLLLHPNFAFALITSGLGSFAVVFYYPILPVVLMEKYGLT